jgi:hypothetical protein
MNTIKKLKSWPIILQMRKLQNHIRITDFKAKMSYQFEELAQQEETLSDELQ